MHTANDLIQKNHNDPELALAELNSNRAMQERMGAPTYQKTRQLIRDHIEDLDRIQKEGVKKEAGDAIKLIVGRKYGDAAKLISNSKYLKNSPEALTLSNAIRTWGKRSDDDISNHSDRAEYLRINKMIDEGEDPAKIQKEIVNTNKIKSGTAYKLLDRLDKGLETDVKHGVTTSNHILSTLISPSKGTGIPVTPEMTDRVSGAQQELQTWALGENKKAVEGKRTPLTSAEIVAHAKEIAPNYQMTVDQQMKSVKEYMSNKNKEQKPARNLSPEETELQRRGYKFKDGKWTK